MWQLSAADKTGHPVGVIDTYDGFTCVLRHRRGGTWTMTMPADHPQSALIGEGARIAVHADWSTDAVMTGPVTTIETSSGDGAPRLTVAGIDDLGLANDRLILPNPASPATVQDVDAYWTATGPAENIIRMVTSRNAGESAAAVRRIFTLGYDTSFDPIGATVTINARFSPLGDTVEELCAAGGVGVRAVANPAGAINFTVVAGSDRSWLVFSEARGNLKTWKFTGSAPKASRVLVAGKGEGTARILRERADTAVETAWGRRIEAFKDARDTDDLTLLDQRGDETLVDSAAVSGLSLEPIDVPGMTFGVDYQLGDTVTVETGGATFTDIVTEVKITLGADGTVTSPSVGSSDMADPTPDYFRTIRDLSRRLDLIERRV